jgi:hypothetical protein
MANRYGEAAILAARGSGSASPVAQWQRAVEKLYPTSAVAQDKNAPRGAFLGLCEVGLVKGVPAGDYSAAREHKAYAVQAVALLASSIEKLSISALWRAVANDPAKLHNNQMDIVLALWNNGLIVRK